MRARNTHHSLALGVLESIQHTTPRFTHRKANPLLGAIAWLVVFAIALTALALASKGA